MEPNQRQLPMIVVFAISETSATCGQGVIDRLQPLMVERRQGPESRVEH
jgi:hypothetical protein